VIAAALLAAAAAGPARAAPTCQDARGATLRCGASGAMPVGWSLPAAERDEGLPAVPPPSAALAADAALLIFAIFALLALLPAFDGTREGDWDLQEGDGDPPR
jgi:hypothetical protein